MICLVVNTPSACDDREAVRMWTIAKESLSVRLPDMIGSLYPHSLYLYILFGSYFRSSILKSYPWVVVFDSFLLLFYLFLAAIIGR